MYAAAQNEDPCTKVQQGSQLQDTSGCFPLTFKPADGGPITTVWVHGLFVPGHMGKNSSPTLAAASRSRSLDIGGTAFFTDPDYGHGSNVDVGAFVAFTGRFFGVEADAADTVRHTGGIREPYVVAGPRFQYRTRHLTVYGKAQAGAGHFSGDRSSADNKKTFVVENYGAGVEFKVSPHLLVRAVDANYQVWPTFANNNLTPFHIGSGLAYSF